MKERVIALWTEWPVTLWLMILFLVAYVVFSYRKGYLPSVLPMLVPPVRRAEDPVDYWVRLVGITVAIIVLVTCAVFITLDVERK
jgi:hypothetical protein